MDKKKLEFKITQYEINSDMVLTFIQFLLISCSRGLYRERTSLDRLWNSRKNMISLKTIYPYKYNPS